MRVSRSEAEISACRNDGRHLRADPTKANTGTQQRRLYCACIISRADILHVFFSIHHHWSQILVLDPPCPASTRSMPRQANGNHAGKYFLKLMWRLLGRRNECSNRASRVPSALPSGENTHRIESCCRRRSQDRCIRARSSQKHSSYHHPALRSSVFHSILYFSVHSSSAK